MSGAARKELLGRSIGPALEHLINQRGTRCCVAGDRDFIPVSTQEKESFTAQVISPIITEGDAVGAVIITSRTENVKMGEVEQKLALAASYTGTERRCLHGLFVIFHNRRYGWCGLPLHHQMVGRR